MLSCVPIDSGGFSSHKPDSVVAIRNSSTPKMRPHNHHNGEPSKGFYDENPGFVRRESVIMSRNHPYETELDIRNGNLPTRESRM